MTIKQRKLADAYAKNGGNGKAAAIAAGYSRKSAKSIASDLLHHNVNVQAYLYRLMDKRGLTDDRLLTVLDEGLSAKKMVGLLPFKMDGTLPDAKEATVDYVGVEDHPTRHKFLETALRMKHPELYQQGKDDSRDDRPLLIVTGPSHQTIVNAPKLIVTPPHPGNGDAHP